MGAAARGQRYLVKCYSHQTGNSASVAYLECRGRGHSRGSSKVIEGGQRTGLGACWESRVDQEGILHAPNPPQMDAARVDLLCG